MRYLVTFEGRKAKLPDGKLFLGVNGDNLIDEVAFAAPEYEGATAYLKMRAPGSRYAEFNEGKIALDYDGENEAWVLSVNRSILALGYKIDMQVQLEAPVDGDDVLVWQSEIFPAYVADAIDADGAIPAHQAPYLQQLDIRVQQAAERAENASRSQPYVGANGNWYVWNAYSMSFVDSGVKAQGPQGPQGPATIEVDPVTEVGAANVENVGTSQNAVLKFTLPGASGAGVSLADAGGYFPEKNAEAALQRVASQLAEKANKEDLDDLKNYVGYEETDIKKLFQWGVGYCDETGFHNGVGSNNNNNKRIAPKNIIYTDKKVIINISEGYRFNVSYYTDYDFSTITGTTAWQTSRFVVNPNKYWCIGQVAEITDTTNISDYRENGLYDALTITYETPNKNTEERITSLEDAIVPMSRTVRFWGNSLTMGAPVYQQNYVKQMESLISNDYTLINHGISGESVQTIGGRQGGIPMMVEGVTIPADTSPVEVTITNIVGGTPTPLVHKYDGLVESGINPCYINGIKGTLSLSDSVYYFARSESGEEVEINRPTPIITDAMKNGKNDMFVLWTGENGGYDTVDELISYTKMIIGYSNTNRFIIIGRSNVSYKGEFGSDYHKKMLLEYGRKYINITEYLCKYGLDELGIEPTETDLSRIESGVIPSSLLASYHSDTVHFSADTYGIVARLVFERGKELGYWN